MRVKAGHLREEFRSRSAVRNSCEEQQLKLEVNRLENELEVKEGKLRKINDKQRKFISHEVHARLKE